MPLWRFVIGFGRKRVPPPGVGVLPFGAAAGTGGGDADQPDGYKMLLRLQLIALTGCVLICFYALQFLHSGFVLRITGVGILIAGAAMLTGCLLGFIFGIPRAADRKPDPAAKSVSPNPVAGATAAAADTAGTKGDDLSVQSNTNLNDISDWLTKILVGVGLVELNKIPSRLALLAEFLGPGMRPPDCACGVSSASCPCSSPASQAVVIAIVIFYFTLGFLFGYVWTRLHFEGDIGSALLQARNKRKRVTEELKRAEAKTQEAEEELERAEVKTEEAEAERKKAEEKRQQAEEEWKLAEARKLQAEQDMKKAADEKRSSDLALQADALKNESNLEGALAKIDEALQATSDKTVLFFTKARILKRLALRTSPPDAGLLRQAIDMVGRAAEGAPGKAAPYYNMACYQALLGQDYAEAFENLARALQLDSGLKVTAQTDSDLAPLRDADPVHFQELTGESPQPPIDNPYPPA